MAEFQLKNQPKISVFVWLYIFLPIIILDNFSFPKQNAFLKPEKCYIVLEGKLLIIEPLFLWCLAIIYISLLSLSFPWIYFASVWLVRSQNGGKEAKKAFGSATFVANMPLLSISKNPSS